jgi:hypothetical protein
MSGATIEPLRLINPPAEQLAYCTPVRTSSVTLHGCGHCVVVAMAVTVVPKTASTLAEPALQAANK